eukprot:2602080-Pleurochrysis_carterae.AAC.1
MGTVATLAGLLALPKGRWQTEHLGWHKQQWEAQPVGWRPRQCCAWTGRDMCARRACSPHLLGRRLARRCASPYPCHL